MKYVPRALLKIFSKRIALFLIGTVVVAGAGVFYMTSEANPHVSELAFIEHSSDPQVSGSVIPASCESGYPHFAGDCVPPPPPPPVVTFVPSPGTINYGQSSTLTWTVANSVSCNATGGWSGAKSPTGGSQAVSPSATTGYTLTCTGPGGTIVRTISVVVNPPSVAFTATPSLVGPGSSSNLSWTVQYATTCTASGGWSGAKNTTSGSETVTPSVTTVYNISCTGPSGTTNVSRTVTMPSGFISATPCTIPAEGTSCNSIVTWAAYNFLGSPSVRQQGVQFSTLTSSAGLSVPASPSSTVFSLVDTGSAFLASFNANIQCAATSVWAGGRCVTLPVIDITADPNLIRSGSTAPIEIEITANYDLTCTITGGATETFNHTPSASAQTYTYSTRPLTSAQIIRVECVSPLYPQVNGDAEERVEVIPTVQEI